MCPITKNLYCVGMYLPQTNMLIIYPHLLFSYFGTYRHTNKLIYAGTLLGHSTR